MYLYEYVMVILLSLSMKALLAFDSSSNTITINYNNLITKQLKQDSIPFSNWIYVLVLAK